MNDKKIPLIKIEPNTWNPNEMTVDGFAEYVREVKHLGKPPKPIVLRRKGDGYEIIDGEHSYKALKELKYQELQEGWFEIVDYDDTEAKRQTYKRNLGGTNNPVKLGQMFAQALRESGMSNRQLADQWGVSEGTIRNYLPYANAAQLRNDYANLATLSKEQVKRYLKIAENAKPIADYWLSCGAIDDALIWFNNEKFNEANTSLFARAQTSFLEIMKQGAEKTLSYKTDFIPVDLTDDDQKKYIQKFKNGIKRAYKMAGLRKRMEAHFNLGGETKQKVVEYLDLYFNSPLSLKATEQELDTLFYLVIKKANNQLEFLLTPEELKQCMELESGENYTTVINKVRLLIAKKHKIAPSQQINTTLAWGGIERQLDDLEIEMKAPDYMRQVKRYIPPKFKLAFLEIEIEDAQLRKTQWELLVKKYTVGEFKRIDDNDQHSFGKKMTDILFTTERHEQEIKDHEALMKRSELELAELFAEKINNMFKEDENAKRILVEKMANNFSREFLYLFVHLASKYYDERKWQELRKNLLTGIHDTMKSKKGGDEL